MQLFVIGAITLVTAEIGLRIYNPIFVPLRANNIVLPVNRTFTETNPYNKKVDAVNVTRYNSIGFRGPEYPQDPEKFVKILTVGGSTTASVSLTEGKTWPDLLYRELQRHSDRYWLNNAGLDGHSTFGHLILLERYIAELAPDYILYLIGVNDVDREDLNWYDQGFAAEALSMKDKIVAASELLATAQTIKRSLMAYDHGLTRGYDMDFASLPRLELSETEMAQALARQAGLLPRYRERVHALIRNTRAIGAEPVLLTQPALYGRAVDPTLSIDLANIEYIDGISSELQWEILELYNDVVRELATQEAVLLIDLGQQMPKDSRYYFDWIHYSNEGAQLVAKIVGDALIPYLDSQVSNATTQRRNIASANPIIVRHVGRLDRSIGLAGK